MNTKVVIINHHLDMQEISKTTIYCEIAEAPSAAFPVMIQSPLSTKKCKPMSASSFLSSKPVSTGGISAQSYSRYTARKAEGVINSKPPDTTGQDEALVYLQELFSTEECLRLCTLISREAAKYVHTLVRKMVYDKDKKIESLTAKLDVHLVNQNPAAKKIEMLENEILKLRECLAECNQKYSEEIDNLQTSNSQLESSAEWQANYTAELSSRLHSREQELKFEQIKNKILGRELEEAVYLTKQLEAKLMQVQTFSEQQAINFALEKEELVRSQALASITHVKKRKIITNTSCTDTSGHPRSSAHQAGVVAEKRMSITSKKLPQQPALIQERRFTGLFDRLEDENTINDKWQAWLLWLIWAAIYTTSIFMLYMLLLVVEH